MQKLFVFLTIPLLLVGCTKKEAPKQEQPQGVVEQAPEKPVEPDPPPTPAPKPETPLDKAIEEAQQQLPLGVMDSVIEKVQKNYDGMQDLEVNFTQEVTKLLKTKPSVSKGVIKIIKPNKVFWHTTEPEEIKTIADGETIWVYDPGNQQLFIQPEAESHHQTKIAMLFLAGKGKIRDQFHVGSKEGKLYEWKLFPKESIPQVKSITATVDSQTKWFKKITIVYTYNETIELAFDGYKVNQGLAEQHKQKPLDPNISPDFKIQVPPQTKIIKSPIR